MITVNGKNLLESSTFPGGEEHIKIPKIDRTPVLIDAKIRNSSDAMKLFLVADAVFQNYEPNEVILKLLYFPYARQDRICNSGEAYSLRAFCSLLTRFPFSEIIIADPHSSKVAEMLYEWYGTRVRLLSNIDIFASRAQPILSNILLVAPDAGATKRVRTLAEFMNVPYMQYSKVRDPKTGAISRVKYEFTSDIIQDLSAMNALVIDDICDGGGTFIALAERLEIWSFKSTNLYVTHGIFSKGLEPLFNAGYSKIYTTNSFCDLAPIKDKFYVWNI